MCQLMSDERMQTSVVEAMACAALPHWAAQLPKLNYIYLLRMSSGKIAVLADVFSIWLQPFTNPNAYPCGIVEKLLSP